MVSFHSCRYKSPAKSFIKKFKCKNTIFLFGDIHKPFFEKYGSNWALNTGPTIRRSIDECDHKPFYIVYDSVTNEFTKKNIKFNKDVFSREHIDIRKEQIERKINIDSYVDSIMGKFIKKKTFKESLIDNIDNVYDYRIKKRLKEFLK